MAERRRQRLGELHESLESLAVEIIANPKLMDSDHWQFAIQLFRTKSFDSIVRYFASYLPDNYLDRHDSVSVSSSSFSETNSVKTTSTTASSVDDVDLPPFLDEGFVTKEPLSIHTNIRPCCRQGDGPLSPPQSEAMSDSSVSSPVDLESHQFPSNPPSRSMSFSGSESGPFETGLTRPVVHGDDETSQQSDAFDAIVTAESDCSESQPSIDTFGVQEQAYDTLGDDFEDDFPSAQFPEDPLDALDAVNDTLDSDTPTPRQEESIPQMGYVEYKSVVSRRLPSPHRRSPSPSPKYPLSHRREGSPLKEVRRSPEEALSKIQKPMLDHLRRRPAGRRRLD